MSYQKRIIAVKIRNAFIFCNYCMSNTHKLINCKCKNFINFEDTCNKMIVMNIKYIYKIIKLFI
jgi:hypothetical protein